MIEWCLWNYHQRYITIYDLSVSGFMCFFFAQSKNPDRLQWSYLDLAMLDGFGAKAFALQMAPEAHLAPSKVTEAMLDLSPP